jgi:hypothetical protein
MYKGQSRPIVKTADVQRKSVRTSKILLIASSSIALIEPLDSLAKSCHGTNGQQQSSVNDKKSNRPTHPISDVPACCAACASCKMSVAKVMSAGESTPTDNAISE